jgi:hypothetical protein
MWVPSSCANNGHTKGDEHLSTKEEGQKLTIYLHDHITLFIEFMKRIRLNFVVAYNMESLYTLLSEGEA